MILNLNWIDVNGRDNAEALAYGELPRDSCANRSQSDLHHSNGHERLM